MEQFPSNSHTEKTKKPSDAKKVEAVVQGKVTQRRRPLGKRLSEVFVQGEAKSVWSYVAFDILIPAAKDAVADAVSQGAHRMLFGESGVGPRGARGTGGATRVAYQKISNGIAASRPDPRTQMSRRGRQTHNFDEVILETRAEAENVIDQLFEIVSTYEVASVSDLYGLCGITPSYVDDKWGWTDLRGAGVTHIRGGYLLDLPRPEPID